MSVELSLEDLEALMDAGWDIPERDRWKPRPGGRDWDDVFVEDYLFLRSARCTDEEIARRLGLSLASLARRVSRLGLNPDLRDRLDSLIATGLRFWVDQVGPPQQAAPHIAVALREGRVERAGKIHGYHVFRGVVA